MICGGIGQGAAVSLAANGIRSLVSPAAAGTPIDDALRHGLRDGWPRRTSASVCAATEIREGKMCRSIKVLRRAGETVTGEELNAAALQFVRKISGFHKPSKANQAAFDRGVEEVAAASRRLLESLEQRTAKGWTGD